VVRPRRLDGVAVRLRGETRATTAALRGLGAEPGDDGPTVVGEDSLDDRIRAELEDLLDRGENVVVLAQAPEHAAHFPCPTELRTVETAWGSSVFHFTTDSGALACLPRRNVLAAEDSTVQARAVVARIGGDRFPEVPVVIAYKPVPDAMTGTVVGSTPVGAGRLVFCQYRLTGPASSGDTAACALLADLVCWAARPREHLTREGASLADGRNVTRYGHMRRAAS
jgi:hypothetical protein